MLSTHMEESLPLHVCTLTLGEAEAEEEAELAVASLVYPWTPGPVRDPVSKQ